MLVIYLPVGLRLLVSQSAAQLIERAEATPLLVGANGSALEHVVGVLEPSHTPDDMAVFVDLKTTWIIEGLVHGHQDMLKPEAAAGVLKREGANIVANASVIQFNQITLKNLDSFHFHGDVGAYPITAVIAVPHDRKSGVILMGRYEGADEPWQILRPTEVMDELMATILTVQSFIIAGMLVVGTAALATAVLAFLLSLRIRKREIETIVKIGGSRLRIASVLTAEILVVVATAAVLAAGLALLTSRFGTVAIRTFLLS